jgi:hypothetical protein
MTKSVIITFDDGFKGHYYNVLDLLKQYNYKAVFALITKDFDNFWTLERINDLLATGSIIYSHTETHKDMINEYDEKEVIISFEKMKEKNLLLEGFVVPYYKYNKKVQELLAQYNIKFSMNHGARHYNNKKIYYDNSDEFRKNALDLVRFNVPYSTKDNSGAGFNQVSHIIDNMTDEGIVILNFHNVLKKSEISPYENRFYIDYDELVNIFELFKEKNVKVSLPADFL